MENADYRRVLAIGDIHGEYDKLMRLCQKIDFQPEQELLVFLGDYIDRGPDSLRCLRYVWGLKKKYPARVITLLGNHEQMLLEYFSEGEWVRNPYGGGGHWKAWPDTDDTWEKYNGGHRTVQKITQEMQRNESFLCDLLAFLRQDCQKMHCLRSHEKNYLLVHAGIDIETPLDEQTEESLLWVREECFRRYHGQVRFHSGDPLTEMELVVGHTPVQHLDPDYLPVPCWLTNHVLMCDTGAYRDRGRLSCVDIISEHHDFWQA